MSGSLTIDFDSSQLEMALDGLGKEAKAAMYPAVAAGAKVYYDEARLLAPEASKKNHVPVRVSKITGKKYGGYDITPGQLKNAIYRVYSKDQSNPQKATYHISWNHVKAPHGYWMENGNARHPAHPFIRPAFYNVGQFALEVAYDAYVTTLEQKTGLKLT